MELQPQLMHETIQAVLVTLPWKSLNAKEPARDNDKPARDTGETYYSEPFLYRPPDLQRTVCPSPQSLLQNVIRNLTDENKATLSLPAEAKLFAIAVEAGNKNIGGLKVTWQSRMWLERMSSELQTVSQFGVFANLKRTQPIVAYR